MIHPIVNNHDTISKSVQAGKTLDITPPISD